MAHSARWHPMAHCTCRSSSASTISSRLFANLLLIRKSAPRLARQGGRGSPAIVRPNPLRQPPHDLSTVPPLSGARRGFVELPVQRHPCFLLSMNLDVRLSLPSLRGLRQPQPITWKSP